MKLILLTKSKSWFKKNKQKQTKTNKNHNLSKLPKWIMGKLVLMNLTNLIAFFTLGPFFASAPSSTLKEVARSKFSMQIYKLHAKI